MDVNQLVLLGLILVVFLAPMFFQMRRQQRQLNDIKTVQEGLAVGDAVVTSSGVHGTITALRLTEVELEVAPGVVLTWERAVIVRRATPTEPVSNSNTQPGDNAENDSA